MMMTVHLTSCVCVCERESVCVGVCMYVCLNMSVCAPVDMSVKCKIFVYEAFLNASIGSGCVGVCVCVRLT